MLKKIDSTKTYRVGTPVPGFSADYPEFVPKTIKSIVGNEIIASGCKNWQDFFQKNPKKFPISKPYMVYEIAPDGTFGEYCAEGQFLSFAKPGSTNLGDGQQIDDQNYYRRENVRLKAEIERLLQKQDELISVIDSKDSEIQKLHEANEKWWKDEKLPLEKEVLDLKYQVDRIKEDKENSIAALNDTWENEKKANTLAIEKEAMEARFQALENEKAERASSLAGYGEIASAVAVPILGQVLSAAMSAITTKYPNLIPSIASRIGADATPSPEHKQELQQAQETQKIDPATAFQTGAN